MILNQPITPGDGSGTTISRVTTYGARIVDRSTGRFIFSAPSLASPYRVGQMAAGAIAVLVTRDGRRREDLVVQAFVTEGGGTRPMSRSEESAMNSALEQFAEGARAA